MKLKLTGRQIRRIQGKLSLNVIIDQLNEYALDPEQNYMLVSLAKTPGIAKAIVESGRIEDLDYYARMAIEHYYEES